MACVHPCVAEIYIWMTFDALWEKYKHGMKHYSLIYGFLIQREDFQFLFVCLKILVLFTIREKNLHPSFFQLFQK